MATRPKIVSIWADEASPDSLLCSGWLIGTREILTVGHAVKDGAPVFIGLLDAVNGRRLARPFQRHPAHRDAALLLLDAELDATPFVPGVLTRHCALAGDGVALHTVSPLGSPDQQVLTNYAIGNYDEDRASWVIGPENARGHSGGVVTRAGIVVGLLWARATGDPLCLALSTHAVWPWLDGITPVLRPHARMRLNPALDLGRDARSGALILDADGMLDLAEERRPSPDVVAVPNQAPPAPERFVGRDNDHRRLVEAFASGKRWVVIRSPLGGIGKTSLAAAYAQRRKSAYPGGVLWARLDEADVPTTRLSLLEALDERLVPLYKARESEATRAAVYRRALASRACLLVLDNAESAAQVADLLPGEGLCDVIVTTREPLPLDALGRVDLELGGLSPPAAAELFAGRLGRALDATELVQVPALMEALGYLPLAIHIAAGIIDDMRWRVGDYADRFNDCRTLDWLDEPESDSGNVVRRSLELAYGRLTSDEARRAFLVVGLLVEHTSAVELVTSLAGANAVRAEQAVLTLARRGVLELRDGATRELTVHPLVARFARELPVDPDERLRIHSAIGRWYRARLAHWDEAAQSFQYDRPARDGAVKTGLQAVHHFAAATLWQEAQRILVAIADQMTYEGHETRLLREIAALERHAEPLPWLQLYKAHLEAGDRTDPGSKAAPARVLETLVSSADDKLASAALISLAKLRFHEGDFPAARALLLRSRDLKERIVPRDERGLAYIVNELGHIQGRLHDVAGSLALHREALEMQEGSGDLRGTAYTLRRIGTIEVRKLRTPETGLETLERALHCARAARMQFVTITILMERAQALGDLQFYADAIDSLLAAERLARATDDPATPARVLRRLATFYEKVELYGTAHNCLVRSLTALRDAAPKEAGELPTALARLVKRLDDLESERAEAERRLAATTGGDPRALAAARVLRRQLQRVQRKLGPEPGEVRLGKPRSHTLELMASPRGIEPLPVTPA